MRVTGENQAIELNGEPHAVCSKCKIIKPVSCFDRKGSGYQYTCRQCREEYRQANYMSPEYKAKQAIYKRKRYEETGKINRAFVREYLERSSCADCGEDDWIVLEFDHIDDNKSHNVSRMIRQCYTLEKVIAEIAKCDVVCANCHRRRTYQRAGSWRIEEDSQLVIR